MRLLSITAQKTDSTGSGVYLSELVKGFAAQGHQQAVVAGSYREDRIVMPDGVEVYPVYFNSDKLPFPIVGMSDEMPSESTRYCDMTPEMVRQFERAFLAVIEPVVRTFRPDMILCHHLYLHTARVRERFPGVVVCGFCHNTDPRQMQKTDLRREYIAGQIRKLERIFVPQEAQAEGVVEIFHADRKIIRQLGMGYNHRIFHCKKQRESAEGIQLVFAGKIAQKKGVMSLIRSLDFLTYGEDELRLCLAGGAGNEEEYRQIQALARTCRYPVEFAGRLSQEQLAQVYCQSDVFVLPSFFDGLPLTVIEALACGDKVVVTDLPGIQKWLDEMAPGADVRYVPLPELKNTDEPVEKSLPGFERRLARAIDESIQSPAGKTADMSRISWEGICRAVICEADCI